VIVSNLHKCTISSLIPLRDFCKSASRWLHGLYCVHCWLRLASSLNLNANWKCTWLSASQFAWIHFNTDSLMKRCDKAPAGSVSPTIIASLVIFSSGMWRSDCGAINNVWIRYVMSVSAVVGARWRRSATITAIKRADRKSFVRAWWLGKAVTFQWRSISALSDDEGASTSLRPASFAAAQRP